MNNDKTLNNNIDTTNANFDHHQRVAIVFVNCTDEYQIQELTQLVNTANGQVVLVVNQNRATMDNASLIGSGKLDELSQQVKSLNIEVVVFQDQLSPSQHRNIQDKVECIVLDRTNLILDIFALHATTAEGKIQVELAQLKYTLPKLRSMQGELSRQGAGAGSKGVGIGTRGPGETKLETDKRKIRIKIDMLKKRLLEIQKQRDVLRLPRQKNMVPTISLVGYTNAGKSTLFNALTGANMLVEDKLFATLDTTARSITLPNGTNAIVTDTVGFISNLPHDLVESFKSTLEEATQADIILNVCDYSSPEVNKHIEVTKNLLAELGTTAEIIDVYNKIDISSVNTQLDSSIIAVSALKRTGLDKLRERIVSILNNRFCTIKLMLPFSQLNVLGLVNKYGKNTTINYNDEGAEVLTTVQRIYLTKFADYMVI
ncbi:MAG: GTPase HflX [Clostridia bacterium]|nr:GTPase HflX [Clostridia bacterium]